MNLNNEFGVNGGLSAAFYTLGCRVNQYETQAIEEQFRNAGFIIKSFDEQCDVYVINTCTVTAESDRKSRQIIRRAAQVKKPSSIVIVCGCYSQGNPGEIENIYGVDIILGNSGKTGICTLATEYLKEKKEKMLVTDIFSETKYEEAEISYSDRTRAFVKIVDGCENHCTYCIIPSVRGKIRSRLDTDVISEVRRLAKAGYKEVVLTGIETAAYGKDFGQRSSDYLADLIYKVSETDGIERIRLGSMEPTVFTKDFISKIAKIKKLMPHFHLSLQSGCDEILRLMKRKYNTEQFFNVVTMLRQYIPGVELTTDIIVGFPGETQELFDKTAEYVKKCSFSAVHVFPYSVRKGTVAESLPGQVLKTEKKRRVTALESIVADVRKDILDKYTDKTVPVLLETVNGKRIDGFTPGYLKVIIEDEKVCDDMSGKIIEARIAGTMIDSDGTLCLLGVFEI